MVDEQHVFILWAYWKQIVPKNLKFRENIGKDNTHMPYHSFFQQALFFGSHDKVVRIIFVVDNVLQVNTLWQNKRHGGEGTSYMLYKTQELYWKKVNSK